MRVPIAVVGEVLVQVVLLGLLVHAGDEHDPALHGLGGAGGARVVLRDGAAPSNLPPRSSSIIHFLVVSASLEVGIGVMVDE